MNKNFNSYFLSTLCILAFSTLTPTFSAAQSSEKPLTPSTFIQISKQVLPSVVSIQVEILPSQELMDKYGVNSFEQLQRKLRQEDDFAAFRQLWQDFDPQMFGSTGSGSGIVVNEDDEWGYVITNRHVLEESKRVRYTLIFDSSLSEDPLEISGEDVAVVGKDDLTDLAVIKFRLPKDVEIPVADFADSNTVMVGEWVLALGNPLDLNNSVSQGIISAKNRNISRGARIEELLQTTAVINPGNSGGPLVNLDGKIIGINNAIASTTGRWSGIGFAIPSNQAQKVSQMLISEGRVTRGYLGIQMETTLDEKGVEIIHINPDTPAMEVGLKTGDVVKRVDGSKVFNTRDLLSAIGNRLAGETVDLSIERLEEDSVKEVVFSVQLAERPSEDELSTRYVPNRNQPTPWNPTPQQSNPLSEQLGLSFEPEIQNGESGLKITAIEDGSAAQEAGLKKGDLLIQINGIATVDSDSFEEGFSNVNPGDDHFILFNRDGSNQFIKLPQ